MITLLDGAASRAVDAQTMDTLGIPSAVLMERAALGVCRCAENHRPKEKQNPTCGILCGSGNNGGDGFACARILTSAGWTVYVQAFGDADRRSPSCKLQADILAHYPVTWMGPEDVLPACDVYIDALFGTGLARAVEGRMAKVLQEMDRRADGVKIAVDIPSGISSDNGALLGAAIHCDYTVTMQYQKPGHLLYPGASYCGQVVTEPIGLTSLEMANIPASGYALTACDLKEALQRDPSGNKGTFGKVLIVAGSESVCGAAILCAQAALKSGCGMVRVFTHEANRNSLMQALPEAMCDTCTDGPEAGFFDAKDSLMKLSDALVWADTVVIGPGIGLTERSRTFLSAVLSFADMPVIIDADAIRLIAEGDEDLRCDTGLRVLTPHLGEMSALTKKPVPVLHETIASSAKDYAAEKQAVCVLKDSVSVISDGETCYYEADGNDGMATAGSGDVLAGILGAIFARIYGKQSNDAAFCAACGAKLHALAGRKALETCGADAMTASDLIRSLPEVFRSL